MDERVATGEILVGQARLLGPHDDRAGSSIEPRDDGGRGRAGVQDRPAAAARSSRSADNELAVDDCGSEIRRETGRGQDIVGTRRARRSLGVREMEWRDESEVRQAHRLHRPRDGADVARMRGFDENNADGYLHGKSSLSAAAEYSTLHGFMHGMVNIAIRAARRAGEIMIRQLNHLEALEVAEKGRNDFVTRIDHMAEEAIIEVIRDHHPEHAILAEESGVSGKHETQWIIDPLDGTTNYLHGFPVFSVSIAVMEAGELQHGVVYDPLRQEIFSASRGQGAQLDGRRIRVSKQATLKGALIATGFPYRTTEEHIDNYLKMLRQVMIETAGVRRPGSAALDLCYLAAGRVDGFWELGLRIWDVAAGALIIREAGGRVSDFRGTDDFLESGNIVGGTPKVYAALSKLLAPYTKHL